MRVLSLIVVMLVLRSPGFAAPKLAEEPLVVASGLVAKYLQAVLVDGKAELAAGERARLNVVMRLAGEKYGRLPLSSKAGGRYDALLALDRGFSAASLGSARVAEALLRVSGEGDALARAANGAMVWQAARAVAAASVATDDAETVARKLARAFVPACPAHFATLPETGPLDEDALRTALATCTLGTPGVTPPEGRSMARELVRRVLVEASDARDRLSKLGSGPWKPEIVALDQALERGVRVPWEISNGEVDGVWLPVATRPAPVPSAIANQRVVLENGSHHVVLAPRAVIVAGISTIDDGHPERRLAHTDPHAKRLIETSHDGALFVLAHREASVAAVLLLPDPPANLAALALAVWDPDAHQVGVVKVSLLVPPRAVTLKIDSKSKSWQLGKKKIPFANGDALSAALRTTPLVAITTTPGTTVADLVRTILAAPVPLSLRR